LILHFFFIILIMYLSSKEVGGPYDLNGNFGQYKTTLHRLMVHFELLIPISFSFINQWLYSDEYKLKATKIKQV
ncbi:MAG: hypothetical protein ACTSPI_17995, partial [Candidatus Heimdallarchaeaceae archaeon]